LAPRFGLEPTDFGKKFHNGRTLYTLMGVKASRRKYPFTGVGPKGGRYKFTAEQVKLGLLHVAASTPTVIPKLKKDDRVTYLGLFGKVEHAIVTRPVDPFGNVTLLSMGQLTTEKEDDVTLFTGKRTEDELMADILSAYSGLSPEILTGSGGRSQLEVEVKSARLLLWLSGLIQDIGHEVSEDEAYNWTPKKSV